MRSQTLHMSEAEYDAWVQEHGEVRTEYVDGKVIVHISDTPRNSELVQFLSGLLRLVMEATQDGRLFTNVESRLRIGLRRVPDIMYVPHDKDSAVQETHLLGAPALAIEVVARDSVKRDWHDKLTEYEHWGVQEYWIVDERKKEVAVHRRNARGYFDPVPPIDGVHRSTVIPAFWLREAWLWQNPLPKTMAILRELGITTDR